MEKNDDRLRPIFLYHLLLTHTDTDHPLSTRQIQELMESEYGIHMHRTTVNSNIDLLRKAGFEIGSIRSRSMLYYFDGREFELPELKILIDAVQSSKFITRRKSGELVEKLLTLTSQANAANMKRNLLAVGRVKSDNEKGYYIVDTINEAINARKQIAFQYTRYNTDRQRVLRNSGNEFVVSPFSLVWNGDYYYMVAFDHAAEELRHYRVDRIAKAPRILEDESRPIPENFDAGRYSKEVFRMFGDGNTVSVTLVCENETMDTMVDKFGTDFSCNAIDGEHFSAEVQVVPSPTFYSWLFQWNGKIRITGPKAVQEKYREMLEEGMRCLMINTP